MLFGGSSFIRYLLNQFNHYQVLSACRQPLSNCYRLVAYLWDSFNRSVLTDITWFIVKSQFFFYFNFKKVKISSDSDLKDAPDTPSHQLGTFRKFLPSVGPKIRTSKKNSLIIRSTLPHKLNLSSDFLLHLSKNWL